MGADPHAAAPRRRQTGPSEAHVSWRDGMAGSVSAAALGARPSLVSAPRARATARLNASSTTAQPYLFIFGIPGPEEHPGPSIQAARPPAVAPTMIAAQLAALPAQSPDQRFLALVAVQQSSTATQVVLSVVDSSTAAIVARGNLDLPHVTAESLLLVTPAFAADSATVGLVLSVTVRSNISTISNLNPNTGQMPKVPTATWTSHHELAYFDVRSQLFNGPFDLADGASLARVSVIADDKDLFLWTVREAIAARSPKGFKSRLPIRPVQRLAAYPLGSAQARFSVPTAEPWPVSGEPVTLLPTGEIARLAYPPTGHVYSPRT